MLDIFAAVMIVCVIIIVIVDVGVELSARFCRFKWTLMWYATRYLAIICALLLALEVLTRADV